MRATGKELVSQPECWIRAAERVQGLTDVLPARGERVAVIGCGTSFYMGQAYARAREQTGLGQSDAFVASEVPARLFDRVVAISRSGTTTEVLRAVEALTGVPTVAVCAVDRTPIVSAATQAVVLEFADEVSVVQTRFATSALAMLMASIGHDVQAAAADAEVALLRPLPAGVMEGEQFVFLGSGWTMGLANEGGLKLREAAGAWTEAYPPMEYRHGPISVAGPHTVVWAFSALDPGLRADIDATGARVVESDLHPMAQLVMVQRLAVALAESKGLDPDRPRHLTRSVVLPS